MKDEEGAGVIVLFHEVLSFVDAAEFEFVEEGFLDVLIFHERRKGEMSAKAFEDEGFIDEAFFLFDEVEVLVDFVVVGALDGSVSIFFSSSLGDKMSTYSSLISSSLSSFLSLRSIMELRILLYFLFPEGFSSIYNNSISNL